LGDRRPGVGETQAMRWRRRASDAIIKNPKSKSK
jgi:hypothetical protein